jgi:hypothetical protein
MTEQSQTNLADDQNVAVWFAALEDVLFCVPRCFRLEALRRLIDSEKERQADGPIRFWTFSDIDPAEFRCWRAEKEAASLIVQVLTRSITNNHSPDDAAKVLFREHRMGTGSGWLPDYLDGLPGITVDLKRCQGIADANGKSELARTAAGEAA